MKIYLTFIAFLISGLLTSKSTFASEPCTPMTALIKEKLVETDIPRDTMNQSDRVPPPGGDTLAEVFKSPEQNNDYVRDIASILEDFLNSPEQNNGRVSAHVSDFEKILSDEIPFELDFDENGETSSESEKSTVSSAKKIKIESPSKKRRK